MKTKHLLILFILILFNQAFGQQKTCKVQGVIRYHFNDFLGYKADLGAQILIIPITTKNKVDTLLHYNNWKEYEMLLQRQMVFYDIKGTSKDPDWVKMCYNQSGYKESDNDIISTNAFICVKDLGIIEKNNIAKYKILIDATGSYSIDLPFGRYYFIFISNNRKRMTLLEISHRYFITEIQINESSKIFNYDFEY